MVGLILCAGLGTRLNEETKDMPKCMVDVAGKPVLERIADHMNKRGVWRIVVNLHSYPDVVMKHFGQRFLYLYEPVPTGEFATYFLVRGWFPTEDILVVNGDTLTDLDFTGLGYGVYCANGTHMGIKKIGPRTRGKEIEVKCWYQDIGTPEGLKKAREYYGKKTS